MVVAISSIDLCVDDSHEMPSRRIIASASRTSARQFSIEAYLLPGRRSLRICARRSGSMVRPKHFFLNGASVEGIWPRSKSSGMSG